MKFLGNYPQPHTKDGKELNAREFALHEPQCSGKLEQTEFTILLPDKPMKARLSGRVCSIIPKKE